MTVVQLQKPLTPHQCAELAGVHYQTILRKIRAGDLPAFHPPGLGEYRVRPSDFERWLYGTPVEPTAQSEETAPIVGAGPAEAGSFASLRAIERGAA